MMRTWRKTQFEKIRGWTIFAAAAVSLTACQPAAEENDAGEVNAAEEPAVNLPAVPRPEPPMDRSALLTAIARAASARAAGADDAEVQRGLDGRLFEFRIRFGCRGPAPDLREAMFGWSRDEGSGTLRLRATPTIGSDNDIVQRVAGDEIEDVEGFWVPRPWLLTPACPAAAAAQPAPPEPAEEGEAAAKGKAPPPATTKAQQQGRAAPLRPTQAPGARPAGPATGDVQEMMTPPPAYPKIGLAQFYMETDPRTRRRANRPYEAVKTLPPEELVGAQGFNLVLSGRLRAVPGKGVIHCISRGSDAPPDCLVSVDIDKVWIEQPGVRAPLAEWGGG